MTTGDGNQRDHRQNSPPSGDGEDGSRLPGRVGPNENGSMRYWGTGVLGCWGVGVLGCWGVGVLRNWGTAELRYWSTGVSKKELSFAGAFPDSTGTDD
jgi:hypothetical protein